MSEDYAVGGFDNLDADPELAEGPGLPSYLPQSGDGDDLPSGCPCGEKPKCYFVDPMDCIKAKAQKARLAEEPPATPSPRESATSTPQIRDEGGVWVTYTSEGIIAAWADELSALRSAVASLYHVKWLEWGEEI